MFFESSQNTNRTTASSKRHSDKTIKENSSNNTKKDDSANGESKTIQNILIHTSQKKYIRDRINRKSHTNKTLRFCAKNSKMRVRYKDQEKLKGFFLFAFEKKINAIL